MRQIEIVRNFIENRCVRLKECVTKTERYRQKLKKKQENVVFLAEKGQKEWSFEQFEIEIRGL